MTTPGASFFLRRALSGWHAHTALVAHLNLCVHIHTNSGLDFLSPLHIRLGYPSALSKNSCLPSCSCIQTRSYSSRRLPYAITCSLFTLPVSAASQVSSPSAPRRTRASYAVAKSSLTKNMPQNKLRSYPRRVALMTASRSI